MIDVGWFFSTFITFMVTDYLFCKLRKRQFDISFRKCLWVLVVCIVWVIINHTGEIQRSILSFVISTILLAKLYNEKLPVLILSLLLIFIIMMISETIFIVLFVHVPNTNVEIFQSNVLAEFFANLFTLFVALFLIHINYLRKILVNIVSWYSDKKLLNLIFSVIVAFGIIIYFTYLNYTGFNSLVYLLGINIVLVAIYMFVIGYFKERAENHKLLTEYDLQMNYVKTYENLALAKQKEQHEYRNQLSLIRSMIESKDNKILSYIDKLLEIDNKNQSHQYFNQLVNIPSGGLKGFILFKITEMVDLGIEVIVNVESELKNEEYWKICDKELTDISRAIGVYLDNAKESASLAEQKFVIIDVAIENDVLTFTFSNTFTGEIDFSKLGQQGYSTKGPGRGYGLSLINELIDKNIHLDQSKQINGIYYVQKLTIK